MGYGEVLPPDQTTTQHSNLASYIPVQYLVLWTDTCFWGFGPHVRLKNGSNKGYFYDQCEWKCLNRLDRGPDGEVS